MSIKDKIKSALQKTKAHAEKRLRRNDKNELAAEEVIEKEVFPKSSKKCSCAKKKAPASRKPASKRSRPTNADYQMIDPDDNTCDTSQS